MEQVDKIVAAIRAGGGGGGGGSTVSWYQILTDGEHIADVEIDGETIQVFAPSGSGSHEYSTVEHVVGTWVNGSPVYEIVIQNPTNGMSLASLTIDEIVEIRLICTDSGNKFVAPYADQGFWVSPYYSPNTQQLTIHTVSAGTIPKYLVLRYTKL